MAQSVPGKKGICLSRKTSKSVSRGGRVNKNQSCFENPPPTDVEPETFSFMKNVLGKSELWNESILAHSNLTMDIF